MRPLLLAALTALSACSGAGCMEGMANTCRLLGGSPDQAALYRSANPSFAYPVYVPTYAPAAAPVVPLQRPTRCFSSRQGAQVVTTCQ